jgi:hypothetical protein
MDINQKGCFAEYKFATMAIENGFNVSMPLLDASAYDCILEKNNKFFKLQVKYFTGAGNHTTIRHGNKSRGGYSLEEVDYFAVWNESCKGFFILKNTGQLGYALSKEGKYKENFNNFNIIL